ncbi:MAG: 16S rRNA processing protein RimM [Calditrichaeota bacterium]|nr:MAG: 16S rRNA processing protein RimM [Calditrichota bacterium]
MQNMSLADSLVTIGKILKPHGVQGIVKILATTDAPERYRLLEKVRVRNPRTGKIALTAIEHLNIQTAGIFIKFSGINDRNEAETLRDCELIIDQSECLPLKDGSHYFFELEGLAVVDTTDEPLGKIVRVLPYPAHDIYVMQYKSSEVMIPAVAEFIKKIDIAAGKMIINPVAGLLPEEK